MKHSDPTSSVNGKVIAELKSVEALLPVHAKQLLTQLRLSGLKLGPLINFGEAHLKNEIKRVINGHLDAENSPEFSLVNLCGRRVRNSK